jgi:hypothetical protein
VKSRDCKPWTELRESAHSRNCPGRRLSTASSALKSARKSVVKTDVKEFSRNLKAFPFKINAHPINPYIRDPSVKISE